MTRAAAWLTAGAVAVVAAVGVLVPHRWEGPVILAISHSHGVHVTDLVFVGVAVAAIAKIWRSQPRR